MFHSFDFLTSMEISSSPTETTMINLYCDIIDIECIYDRRLVLSLERLSHKQNQSAFSISLDKIPILFPSVSFWPSNWSASTSRRHASGGKRIAHSEMASVSAYFACRTNSCCSEIRSTRQRENSICIHERRMLCILCLIILELCVRIRDAALILGARRPNLSA
jgi:hypothetical protein